MAPSLHFHIPKKLIKAYRDAPEVSIAEASQSPIDRRVSVSGILQQVSNLFSISSNQRNSRPERNYQKVREFLYLVMIGQAFSTHFLNGIWTADAI